MGEITLDSFITFMTQKYPENIKASIKNTANEVMRLINDQKKARKRRDAEDSSTVPTESEVNANSDSSSTLKSEEGNGKTEAGVVEGESSTIKSETDNQLANSSPMENEPKPTEKATEVDNAGEPTDKPTEAQVVEKTTKEVPPTFPSPKPFYRYLASFDYYDQFKANIPDEELFIIWDAYYVAEFQVCQEAGGSTKTYLMEVK